MVFRVIIRGHLRRLAVARWTIDHYHPYLNPSVGISEGCFIFDFAFGGRSAHLAYHVHNSGRKTSIIIIIIRPIIQRFINC